MAGEARNPQRDIPLAIIGAVGISLVIYILLQVAFIGVIPPDHLKQGWQNISEKVPGGPFARFATLLGLTWLAFALYIDAVISPSGTGFAATGATARINYAMSKNGQFPAIFERVNRFKVPVWSLIFNFVVGMIVFLPFPAWAELVGFISSSVVLSLAFGPVSLAALRYQMPDLARPFRVPCAIAYSAICFVFVGYVVYLDGLGHQLESVTGRVHRACLFGPREGPAEAAESLELARVGMDMALFNRYGAHLLHGKLRSWTRNPISRSGHGHSNFLLFGDIRSCSPTSFTGRTSQTIRCRGRGAETSIDARSKRYDSSPGVVSPIGALHWQNLPRVPRQVDYGY